MLNMSESGTVDHPAGGRPLMITSGLQLLGEPLLLFGELAVAQRVS